MLSLMRSSQGLEIAIYSMFAGEFKFELKAKIRRNAKTGNTGEMLGKTALTIKFSR